MSSSFTHLPAYAYSQDLLIPKWFLTVYQFLQNGQISEGEFENALRYLQETGIIKLSVDPSSLGSFLITQTLIEQNRTEFPELSDCTPGWYITGYFTPHESDYSDSPVPVTVEGATYQLREDFVKEVKVEGWGKTVSGKYVGWYGGSFHLSNFPLDSLGNNLNLHIVAADPSLIRPNSLLRIPTLDSPWDEMVFLASDVGTAIIGKHVDVYTGEGKKALDETFRITGHENTVCVEAK